MAVFAGSGSAAAPGLSFAASTDTGLFRPADGELGFSADGLQVARAIKGANNSLGQLLIGDQTSARLSGGVFGPDGNKIQLEGLDPYDSVVSLAANVNGTSGSVIQMIKSRGTTANAVTQVNNGDVIGDIRMSAANSVDIDSTVARIISWVDGTYTPGAGAAIPGRLVFSTGSSSVDDVARVMIGGDGRVRVANASGLNPVASSTTQANTAVQLSPNGGIIFGNAADSSQTLLDDYEEGDWTPALGLNGDQTDFNNSTSGSRAGRYVKIGRTVYIWGFLWNITKANPLTTSGTITVDGLPFAVSTFYAMPNPGQPGVQVARYQNTSFPTTGASISAQIGTQRLAFFGSLTGSALTEADLLGGTTTGIFEFSLCYTADT